MKHKKHLQGKEVTIIQARTILIDFQIKVKLFESPLVSRDFKYLSKLRQLEEDENTPECDL